MSLPLVLGLSHLFGEAADLDDQVNFWGRHGFVHDFDWHLPVSPQKQQLLLSRPADEVRLRYLKWASGTGVPGLEFLRHHHDVSDGTWADAPLLSLFLQAGVPGRLVDGAKNEVVLHPSLSVPTTVVVKVFEVPKAGEFLRTLGLVPCSLERDELRILLGGNAGAAGERQGWMLSHRLFPQLAVRLVLVSDAGAEARPQVDRLGWSGLSFLTANLDAVHRQLSLIAQQTIERPQLNKEVAFYNDAGILTEFLALNRQR